MATSTSTRPPGIGRVASFYLIRKFKNNYLRVYECLKARFGCLCTVYLPHLRYLVFHPDDIKHCLRDNFENYAKGDDYRELQPLFGDGLVTSDGKIWHEQRRQLASHFQHSQLRQYQGIFVRRTRDMLDRWTANGTQSELRDVTADFADHAFVIAGDAFFGTEFGNDAFTMRQALATVLHEATQRMVNLCNFPLHLPTPANRRYLRAVREIDRVVFEAIDRRLKSGIAQADLLSALLNGSTAEGTRCTSRLVRDQLVTFMIAGHETSGLSLAWTLGVLSHRQDIQDNVAQEVRDVLGGNEPSFESLARLTYTKMVIQEILRLYPPAPVISRCTLSDMSLRGCKIEAGSTVTFPVGVTHRDPERWDSPAEFRPERFDPHVASGRQPFAFMPFGVGARSCIGETFAYHEMLTVIAMVCQRYSIEAVGDALPDAFPKIMLHPTSPILVTVRRRNESG